MAKNPANARNAAIFVKIAALTYKSVFTFFLFNINLAHHVGLHMCAVSKQRCVDIDGRVLATVPPQETGTTISVNFVLADVLSRRMRRFAVNTDAYLPGARVYNVVMR